MEYFYPDQNPNPNSPYTCFSETIDSNNSISELEWSDYLMLNANGLNGRDSQTQMILESSGVLDSSSYITTTADYHVQTSSLRVKNGEKINNRMRMDDGIVGYNSNYRVAFRTKSELEIMDDGFKWRKYGKKSVKNSPNPRNYYKCSNGGCEVKKRVERDREDGSYVITTYKGVHNHDGLYPLLQLHADADV